MAKVNGEENHEAANGGVESDIKSAMSSRVNYFRDQSDSLTFEGVRRLLEKDLGMQEFSLDSHKRFVKQLLLESLNRTADSMPQDSRKSDVLINKGDATDLSELGDRKFDIKESNFEDVEKMEDSPVMGLLKRENSQEIQETENKGMKVPTEAIVIKALTRRTTYILQNSETITMAGLRRMLEEDLNLEKYSLDPLKKFISHQLDELMNSSKVSQSKKTTKNIRSASTKKDINKSVEEVDEDEKTTETEEEEEIEDEEEEDKPKKKPRKRKITEKETKSSTKKQKKSTEKDSQSNGVDDDSEGSNSEASAEKPLKKKDSPAYGKRVEHLKSIIKSCSMSVPPSIYKKVKQLPENKRETNLIKELEAILSKEGLSSNPSEKEIKDVKRRKERTKELEGIDMSNIVSSSRRRSTASYAAPVKPKIPVETDDTASDSDEVDEDKDSNEDEEDDENIDDDEGEGDDENVEDDEGDAEDDDDSE